MAPEGVVFCDDIDKPEERKIFVFVDRIMCTTERKEAIIEEVN